MLAVIYTLTSLLLVLLGAAMLPRAKMDWAEAAGAIITFYSILLSVAVLMGFMVYLEATRM